MAYKKMFFQLGKVGQKTIVDPEVSKQITQFVQRITLSVFSQHFDLGANDLTSLIAKKISGQRHNGDLVRETYHRTLFHFDMHYQQGILNGLIGHKNEHDYHIRKAFVFHQIRECIRMRAWEAMDDPRDVDDLKKRNLEEHKREEGPSFDYLIEKYMKKHPHLDLEGVCKLICEKGLGSTSKDYDAKFGFEQIAIHVHEEGLETVEMRQMRLHSNKKEFDLESLIDNSPKY